MRVLCAFCGLFLAIAIVNCSPIVKREAEDDKLSPLNEVYVVEAVEDEADDGDRGDRDKRKIGVKLGISNGIINFVFDKVDSFIDSKTKALGVLDESNKAKNAAFGIDNKHSATSEFLNHLVSQKIQAATGSIGPIINSAATLFSGASAGLTKALVNKIAPLSSLSGASGGGGGGGGDGHGDTSGGSSGSALIGNLLTQKVGSLSSLSQSSGGLGSLGGLLGGLSGSSGGSGGNGGGDSHSGGNGGASAGGGINLGAFANLAGKRTISTTTEDTPIFDRNRVSLQIPPSTFGTGFTLVTNISKVLNSVILNSARRTETLLEIFKPFFRGTFAIKGLPSDRPK